MNANLQRPAMKLAHTKVSEKDMISFSLGMDCEDYVLPSERLDYRSDERAVQLVQDIKAGKDLSGQDFSGINLKGADISGGLLEGANFSGAIFYHTKARQTNFKNANFSGASLEDTDFSDSCLAGACFQKTYLKKISIQNADLDENLKKRLSAMEFLIHQIETGAIDIHCLTRSELMCLDLRRLDMSRIDISDMDLSMFNLEGINLSGMYINPLQKISMDQWQKDLLAVETLSEQKLKEEAIKVAKQRQKELNEYAKTQKQIDEVKLKNPKRPNRKGKVEEEYSQAPKKADIKPEEKPIKTSTQSQQEHPQKIKGSLPKLTPKMKKFKNRI